MAFAYVQHYVLWVKEENPDWERQLINSIILTHNSNIHDWAHTEITDTDLDINLFYNLEKKELENGYYSIICKYELSGGDDGFGEYWSEMVPVDEYDIERLTEEDTCMDDFDIMEVYHKDLQVFFFGSVFKSDDDVKFDEIRPQG